MKLLSLLALVIFVNASEPSGSSFPSAAPSSKPSGSSLPSTMPSYMPSDMPSGMPSGMPSFTKVGIMQKNDKVALPKGNKKDKNDRGMVKLGGIKGRV
jgi:hypothetical protein